MTIQGLCADLAEEMREIDRLLESFGGAQWNAVTPFFNWTVRDQIMHLMQVERFGLLALSGGEAFRREVIRVRDAQAAGIPLSEQIRKELLAQSDVGVLGLWRESSARLHARLQAAEDGERMPWFGPDMSVKSFASARIMEIWAHGQDIYDTLGQARRPTARLRNICELGVRTFGWSFRNRGRAVPTQPSVCLKGPDGEEWQWHAGGAGRVIGSALDFCLVVTQRRAIEDTRLEWQGESANQWLQIAQCFAGAPQERAAPGSRPLVRTP